MSRTQVVEVVKVVEVIKVTSYRLDSPLDRLDDLDELDDLSPRLRQVLPRQLVPLLERLDAQRAETQGENRVGCRVGG